jgi:hypothetical protein
MAFVKQKTFRNFFVGIAKEEHFFCCVPNCLSGKRLFLERWFFVFMGKNHLNAKAKAKVVVKA